jgi:LysR family transcriptional regulator, regulator for genes of the gallate degradation pathway
MDIWNLNLRHLRAMMEITRLGSISAAAQAVSLTQPAVTQGIAGLERQLGQPLFERRTDGMSATPAAIQLAPRVEAALAHIGSPRVTMAQVRALIALSSSGSYATASAATGLSQPSLHRAVKDLSVALRRALVERRGRGITLSESGRRTVRAFRLARAELNAGMEELAQLKGREVGRIVIGAMPLSRAKLLPKAVMAFHARYPDVQLAIVEGAYSELIEPLRDGEIDLLIGALRDPAAGDDVAQYPLFDDHPVIMARSDHPLAGTQPNIEDLARFPWVIAGPGTPLRHQWERLFSAHSIAAPPVPIESGSAMMIRQILLGTGCLTLLSRDQLAVELDAGLLVELCPAPSDLKRTIGISTRAGWRPTVFQSAFFDALVDAAKLSKTNSG